MWLIPTNSPLKIINERELESSLLLPKRRSREYQHSRGYLRHSLAELFKVGPLDIPLIAPPGKPPTLTEKWGFVSISHCKDALLIAWSTEKIGIDLERLDRSFAAKKLVKRYFCKEEKQLLKNLKGESFRKSVLQKWVMKEAAIKWQEGSLGFDLSQWRCMDDYSEAFHKINGLKVKVEVIVFPLLSCSPQGFAGGAAGRACLEGGAPGG